MAKTSTKNVIRRAAGRANKKKGGLKREERANIVRNLGRETDPNDLYNRSNAPQRRRWQRLAKKRGVTVQGLLSGGQRALQERSPAGLRRQAMKTVDSAYKGAENELTDRETKAKNLRDKEQADAERFDLWMAGEQSKLETAAGAADEALRSRYAAIQAAQNAGFEQGGADDAAGAATADYAKRQVDLARTAAAGATGAAAREAERGMSSASNLRNALRQSVLSQETNRRYDIDTKFHDELRAISSDRKTLKLTKAGDAQKEIARLRDQAIEVGQANRESKMLGRELGLKEFSARADAANDAAQNRLNWHKFKADLNDDQVRRALDRVKVQIAAGNLSRQERADAERARHNLQTELNERLRIKKSGKGGAGGKVPVSEGAKNRWGQVINLSGMPKPDGSAPRLLREAAHALKMGGLNWELYQRLIAANVYVPPRYRPHPNRGTGPH